jgi:transketolase
VSTERLVVAAAYHQGPAYIRTARPKTPVIYSADEVFAIGGSKVLRQSAADVATVVAAGVTVFEAIKAHDQLSRLGRPITVIDAYSVEPVDARAIGRAARRTGGRLLTVEDHSVNGGLGDAVSLAVAGEGLAVHRLGVREIARSGAPEELLERCGIGAAQVVEAVLRLTSVSGGAQGSRIPEGL